MKNVLAIVTLLFSYLLLTSCEDDKITLTVNASAYEVFSTLKDVNGQNYFTDNLPDGLEVRYFFTVVREAESLSENAVVVEKQAFYSASIRSNVSYTTGELIPGIYRVYVVADLVKGDKEYNALLTDQYLAPIVKCTSNSGALSAFGDAAIENLLIEEKTEITLSPERKGTLVTLLFKNMPENPRYGLKTENFEYYSYTGDFSGNTNMAFHEVNASATSAQHYCGSSSVFYISWTGDQNNIPLANGKDKVIEMDFATQHLTVK